MAITYHAGRRIQGLAYTASNITKDEDFSDVWNGVGSNIAITNGELVATSMQSSGDNRVYRHLGFTLVDTAWVLRFEYTPTSSSSGAFYMPIALTAGNGALSASADALRLYIDMGSYTAFFRSKDGSTEGSTGQTVNLSAGTKYYFTVVNNNRSLTATIRTGSHSGSVFSTRTATIQSGVTGLDHIQSGASSFNSGTNTYTVDNIEIWNNMTSISGTATFTENFSSSDIWTQSPTDSQFAVSYSESNTNVNDVAHFEGTVGANYVIGEQITSGNKFIGRKVNGISFWLYKLNSGSSGTETFTFGIWDSSGALQKEYGSITRGEIPQGSTYTDAQKFTKTDSDGYVLQQNDIIGVRTDTNPNSAWTVEIQQRDSDVYSNGQRAIFTQGSTPTTAARDIGFEIISTDGKLDFLDDENSTGDRTWYDLGTDVSTTQWILRFKFRFTTLASGTYFYEFDAGLSDTTVDNNTNQNFIGVRVLPASNANLWRPRVCDGSSSPRTGATANITQSFSTGTDYFAEIKRTSASNWAISLSTTNAYDGDLHDNSYTDASGATGLRYLKIGDAVTNTTAGADMEGYIDDVEFYNDTTTAVKTTIGDEKPTNVQVGSRYEETDTRKMYYRIDSDYVTDKWFETGTVPYAGGRGVFNAGYIGSNTNVLDYVTIDTTGNATDFGDLTVSRRNSGVCANKTRGIICGGYSSTYVNTIDYITIATAGNAVDFGDFGDTATGGIMGIGSETRACFGGGETSITNRIAYVTIATTGNSTDFGDLTVARKGGGTTGDGTKGIFMGGEEGGTNGVTMDYVTIATTGNASDWGDLSTGSASTFVGLVSDGTIGLLALGVGYTNQVDKKTISTNANSTDYGDLTQGRQQGGQCSTETRAVFGGGKFTSGASSGTNTIDYMAISTGGTATDFGDLTQARYLSGGMCDTGADRS
jgi:hypothetical protein